MRVVITGGTGHLGRLLSRSFDDVVVIGRSAEVRWDGKTLGPWAAHVDGADLVINLAGRSVNCRYTKANLDEMMASRVDSTRVVGEAIAAAQKPPRVWLQMSTATIYAHRFEAANDEETGRIGDDDVPEYWQFSVEIARAWERTLAEAATPRTRKVALRTAMVMSREPGGVFEVLQRLARWRLGGALAGGQQFVSWIHERDFLRAVQFLAGGPLEGPVNLCAPNPLPQREMMATLRGRRLGLPATRWMAELGAFFLRTDTELVLKSRRVVPKRLLDAGFQFEFPDWAAAAAELAQR